MEKVWLRPPIPRHVWFRSDLFFEVTVTSEFFYSTNFFNFSCDIYWFFWTKYHLYFWDLRSWASIESYDSDNRCSVVRVQKPKYLYWNTMTIFWSNLNPTDVSWLLFSSTIRSINSRLVVDDDVSYNHNATFSHFAPFFCPGIISFPRKQRTKLWSSESSWKIPKTSRKFRIRKISAWYGLS